MEILALIPARSGSKGIHHKNIASFHGKPLLAHSIEQAREAESVSRVIVSTDSELYADIGKQYGADVPFLRPAEISGDLSTDLECFEHALAWLQEHEGYQPDICVHLRPTYPTRRVDDIERAVSLLLADPDIDSVRSIAPAPETPFKMWFMNDDDMLVPVATSDLRDPHNLPRQSLPQSYLQQANVDVVRTRVILEQHSMTGQRIRGMLLEGLHDIDHPQQLREAMTSAGPVSNKRFVFDIDGVIATLTPQNQYDKAHPIQSTIDTVNRLFDAGNYIILNTARGTLTDLDWREVTENQLQKWGVRHHELHFGKPAGDFYIDDRFISLSDLNHLADSP